jgi:hypothetical protein
MKLIIGCPIYDRAWIFPYWMTCIERQSFPLDQIGFVFVASPEDKETIFMLEAWHKRNPQVQVFDIVYPENVNHFSHAEGSRHWTISKYANMVKLRNCLLEKVREYSPDYFFSLDSDILLINPNTIELLIAHINEDADAVNPLMFMTPTGTNYPSTMKWLNEPGKKAHRDFSFPLGSYFESDIIMAAKMMSREVYSEVDYCVHEQGEDLGWSANCHEKGYSLYCASYIYAVHIMSRHMLNTFLSAGDERQKISFEGLSKV